MKYIIELSIVFSPAMRMLSLLNNSNTEVPLSNQATRLLLHMVIHRNETLLREDLLKRVWEDFGFTRSNNSLNVAISEIRKAFELMGIDPKIINTIPKVGFVFEGNVEPTIKQDDPTEPPLNEDAEQLPDFTPEKNGVMARKRVKTIALCLCVIISASVIYTINKLFFSKNLNTMQYEVKSFLYDSDKCNVFALGNADDHDEDLILMAKNDINNELIDCKSKRTDIFYKKTREKNKVSSITFIGACTLNHNNYYNRCWTILNNTGVTQ